MKTIQTLHPNENIPVPPDSVNTLLIAGSSGQAMDWPTGTHIARLTGLTTAGAQLNFHVNAFSTQAAAPSSGASTQGAAGFQVPVLGQGTFQVQGSTGFSVASLSSGYIMVECWKR